MSPLHEEVVMGYIGGGLHRSFVERVRGVEPERLLAVPIDVGKRAAAALVCDFWGEVIVTPFMFSLDERGLECEPRCTGPASVTPRGSGPPPRCTGSPGWSPSSTSRRVAAAAGPGSRGRARSSSGRPSSSWGGRSDRATRTSPGTPGSSRRGGSGPAWRSEEHTSELQSRENLVCRLLLEKKKKRRD